MDFTLTEAQQDLAELTRSIVADIVTNEHLRTLDASEDRLDRTLWDTLASSGVLGAALPESLGGDGYGPLEQASILRELGRGVAAVPYIGSIAACASAIAEFGAAEQQAEWGRPAATGEQILSAALAEELNPDPTTPATRAQATGDGHVLDGVKIVVDSAPVADGFLVPATIGDSVSVFLVRPDDPGVSITRQQTTDFDSRGIVTLEQVALPADRVLGTDGLAVATWLRDRSLLGSAAYQCGVLEQALELTAQYARERVQFDRPIGSFQAVSQRLADAYIDVKAVRLTLWQAAFRMASGERHDDALRTAAFWAADAGHRVAHTTVHVHGGVGLDEDHPVHRYFLAAKHHEFLLGSATDQLRALGRELADVPA
ncbi:acyl-CoA/acyl-ACP dehydrogenase [Rhodococcus pyridinivorans]|uniref:Acyl-CoA dehydrogenase n=2 Tax=Rhodococcus TaxID=1827 RepID=H0JQK9_9NOCA|nr:MULTISPECIES: acyl-CoA dehydrogenase family protein [Rhodococcus]EHK84116.1 acyl-CoA dehydrogenase [Rhodococcus pyridinivorans AK37]MBX4169560.1 acyl-CoA/acyl-ACP dehydrogenase [Rhodococcus sp. DMU2021]MCD2115764.1 acyl-CoA/acyl-ACP dehydrogenase [Rhodococcus pyridinivorans]MCD2141799.1 acyl-CoA/acyl-ACP dehydrogenase [Rhodococcus pyridinivorans]MCD5420255.1 acyl-CoA/acyl-ACP dehydrogenase [Rhodococcus pyridinivorans]